MILVPKKGYPRRPRPGETVSAVINLWAGPWGPQGAYYICGNVSDDGKQLMNVGVGKQLDLAPGRKAPAYKEWMLTEAAEATAGSQTT